ncbi:glutamate ABC transporter ATP-binding protein [Ralstonia solanacearum]|nr:glutamate ABC transporter ATP-binding protein [Ralstonia solanacearum]BEU67179.1 hypothetical protein MAFF301069_17340 [Ralstonia pseudosolanacearum]AXW16377.1 glutamate ABC transporter ATP-binding protein [Ralstonia solanacearum]AXW39988.1 glutamate ABC transporter ATP-binding protein [Ralstonia solanacearum]OHU98770.1 glutamate ABC transporter ATP-binding protein [Ralstonia solanacearum]
MPSLAEEGMAMAVLTHEMAFARKVGTRLIFMAHGYITVDGPSADTRDAPPNRRLRDCLQHVEDSLTHAVTRFSQHFRRAV